LLGEFEAGAQFYGVAVRGWRSFFHGGPGTVGMRVGVALQLRWINCQRPEYR
jgi:hypothetical protein